MFIGRTDVEAETPILWPPDVKGGEGSGIPSFLFSSLLGVVSAAEATTRTPASGPSYMALTVTGFW